MRSATIGAARLGTVWYALGKLAGAQLPGLAVDPHIVVLTPQMPAGAITVYNPRPSASEFSTEITFGYATTDSAGRPAVELNDKNDAGMSAAGWVLPYPRKFVLQPGASQVIRLVARPPVDLAPGEYWARLAVRSRDVAPPLAQRSGAVSGVHLGMVIETSTIMPIFYRSGALNTGVSIDTIAATCSRDSIVVRAKLSRTGNAAFLGTAHLTVLDSADSPVASIRRPLAVYRTAEPRWVLPSPRSKPGTPFKLAVVMTTHRDDVPARTVIGAEPSGRVLEIILP